MVGVRYVLLMIAVVALVGCGKGEDEAVPMTQVGAEDLLSYDDFEETKAAAEAKEKSESAEHTGRVIEKK